MKIRAFSTPPVLPALPYPENALEPSISSRTVSFHYGKHHKGYVDKLHEILEAHPSLEGLSLEELMEATAGDDASAVIFNQAAQIWNHNFYWTSMKPSGGGMPSGDLLARIEKDLGGFEVFRKNFTEAAAGQFGSGWAWLVLEAGRLKVVRTANADSPLIRGQKPLLTLDVWEHAYYLDFQNRRTDYIKAFFEHLANWDFAARNLEL